jgi:DNA-binding transcriptional MerR regulator
MSLKEADAGTDLIDIPEDEILFEKKYYAIGLVADMFKVNQSLIRFWENEFDILKPKKNGKGDRLFRPEDIKNLKLIYHLLRERKYTMEGAKEYLKQNKRAEEKFALIESLQKLKGFLNELKADL